MARTSYGRLFKSTPHPDSAASVEEGGPAAVAEPKQENGTEEKNEGSENLMLMDEHWRERLHFVFAPDLSALVNPKMDDLVRLPLPRSCPAERFADMHATVPGRGDGQARDS
jgi:hypothetical protein